jgi:hypothetical protein
LVFEARAGAVHSALPDTAPLRTRTPVNARFVALEAESELLPLLDQCRTAAELKARLEEGGLAVLATPVSALGDLLPS